MCRVDPTIVGRYTQFDVSPGGTNCMDVRTPDGTLYRNKVNFQEIKPPEKLVFTWAWERFTSSGEKNEEQDGTLVTVDFVARGTFTEVTLTHERFRTADQCERHRKGWEGCFDQLTGALSA